MSTNPLKALPQLGQSIWLDYIRRDMLEDGTLQRLIDEDALMGMTTNPTIFAGAIKGSPLYDDDIRAGKARGESPLAIFERLAVADVRAACDRFRPVHEATGGRDGYVSIEVSPKLAYDALGTLEEARRLFKAVDRPNVMIKIPGTEPGLQAIEATLYEGISVNITLLFSVERYDAVMDAWFRAMERRAAEGRPLAGIASVASFFVSRVDSLVDSRLLAIPEAGADGVRAREALHRAAIANARLAYARFEERFRGGRFQELAAQGAMIQRPLWASTSTKDPRLSDVLYVDTLVGPDTVNTLPPATLDAYRDHGEPAVRIRDELARARELMGPVLTQLGIDMGACTQALEEEGVEKFAKSFDELLQTIEAKAGQIG